MNLTKGLLLLLLLLVPLGWGGCSDQEVKKLNVVLIVIDTLRADRLPFYGYKTNTAPFMSKMARQSVVFEKAFSPSCWTSPATASILTSLYPFQHGVTMGFLASRRRMREDPSATINRIPEAVETFAEVLKNAGYATYAVTDNHNICALEGFDQGFDRFENHYYHGADVVNQDVAKWEEEIKSQDRYFLYLHYMDPHTPLHGRKPWYQWHKDKKEDDRAKYDSEISFVDKHIGQIFKRYKWNEDTLVIITADHGEELWDRGQYGHRHSLFNEVIHVPLMILFPRDEEFAGRVKENVSTIDVLPTVVDYLGLEKTGHHEGVSLMPLIRGDSQKDRYLFSHMDVKEENKNYSAKSTIFGDLKYYAPSNGPKRLFNLNTDPRESKNLWEKEQDTARRFDELFEHFAADCLKYQQENSDWDLDPETLKRLEALGY